MPQEISNDYIADGPKEGTNEIAADGQPKTTAAATGKNPDSAS